ncbi:hypothetical protein FRX31_024400 [Thalictrum thalictroides]|uniref:Uncharacterized protein n=1 Tax=Thalictrum thalictroides TaxID=46969 RepID=A0A7J6VMM2_THATH|nr:hypothetical protein FRX31_024400 [Thalictrum thalictroides]
MASSLLGGILRRTIEEKISCEFPRKEGSLLGGILKGTTEVKNSCKFPRKDDSKVSGLSSFLNINFFKRDKCRFLNKTTHNVSHKNLLPHEVTSLENDIGSKKSRSNSEEEFGSQCFEINDDILFISETASEDSDSSRISIGSADRFNCEDHASSYFSLSDFSSSKVKFEIEEDVKLVMVSCQKGVQEEVCPAYTQSPAKHKIFLARTKPSKIIEVKSNQEVCRKSFGELHAEPKLRKSFSSEKEVNTDVDKEEESDNTLYKKKILMGRRCQPLDEEYGVYKTKSLARTGDRHNSNSNRTASSPKVANKSKSMNHQDVVLQTSLYRIPTFS